MYACYPGTNDEQECAIKKESSNARRRAITSKRNMWNECSSKNSSLAGPILRQNPNLTAYTNEARKVE